MLSAGRVELTTQDRTILIVDDEVDLADTCARLLQAVGYRCVIATSVAHAISLFDSERPSLVLSDITLPVSNGFEIARYVRGKSPVTPVILMTAYHTPQVARDAEAAGAAGYVRKPFANKDLVATINSVLTNLDGH
jgi:two-component system, NtrC family, response regulator HydG